MFIGEYQYNLDDKGRLFIPVTYKNEIGGKLIVARGIEKCLYIYTMTEWEKLISKISDLSFTKKSNREFSRMFLSGAFEYEIDSKGRVNLDSKLLTHASLKKECILLGAGSRIEIWSKDVWDNYYNEHEEIIEEISEELDF